jgi:hypothetical protein
MTLPIYRVEILKLQSTVATRPSRSSTLPFAVGTVASKDADSFEYIFEQSGS